MGKTNFTISGDKKTLIVERTFNVPKHKLWKAYSTATAIARWFGPVGWETEVSKLDFVEGGEWIYIMKCVDKAQGEWYGKTSCGKGIYTRIDPENSFEYTDYFTDDNGNIDESLPSSQSILVFQENEDGYTTLKVTTMYDSAEALKQVIEMGMEEGYAQTLDKLETFLLNK